MTPYVFFLDIDDTIAIHSEPTPHLIQTLHKAQAMGHKIIIDTGRAPSYLPEWVRQVPFDGYVCGCGAYVELGGKILERYALPTEDCIWLCRLFSFPDAPGLIFEGEQQIVRYRTSRWEPQPTWITVQTPEEADAVLRRQTVTKVNINHDISPEIIPVLEERFSVIWHPTEFYTECCYPGRSKATGIETVMKAYGLPHSRSVAIGDSENDLDMIRYAAVGIAMGQSKEEIKAQADRVTGTIEEEGAVTAIEQLIAEAEKQ